MSDSYGADIPLTNSYRDLAVAYPAMAGVMSWVCNKGPSEVLVQFTASGSTPTGGGVVLKAGDTWAGQAAHCWARLVNPTLGAASVSVGVV